MIHSKTLLLEPNSGAFGIRLVHSKIVEFSYLKLDLKEWKFEFDFFSLFCKFNYSLCSGILFDRVIFWRPFTGCWAASLDATPGVGFWARQHRTLYLESHDTKKSSMLCTIFNIMQHNIRKTDETPRVKELRAKL